jgi:hypothetical protein
LELHLYHKVRCPRLLLVYPDQDPDVPEQRSRQGKYKIKFILITSIRLVVNGPNELGVMTNVFLDAFPMLDDHFGRYCDNPREPVRWRIREITGELGDTVGR